ncbi:MAG: ATP synthase F1 subunit delta [Phycisphaerales bacterium JB063]
MARKGFWSRLFGGDDPPEQEGPDPIHADGSPAEHDLETPPDESPDTPRDDTPRDGSPDQPPREDANEPQAHEAETEHDADAEAEPLADAEADDAPPARDDTGAQGASHEPHDDAETPAASAAPDPGDFPLSQTAELKTDAVGRVYAEALLDLARESGEQDAIAQEVSDLLPLVEPGSDLHRLVTNPVISAEERSKIVSRVFEGKVSDLLVRFLKVVADKDRLGSLHAILSGYLLAMAESGGKITVDAYVATPMDEATASRVAQRIGESMGKEVALLQHVDDSLIGGLKIKVGDKLIDASVASQLRVMKNKMIEAGGAKGPRGQGA